MCDAFSLPKQCPAQVIELRISRDIKVAWAHLSHEVGGHPRTSVLTELFVWPSFRRRGYGSVLESAAVESARAWGAERLRLLLHEMDAQPAARTASQRFGRRTGYRWRRRESSRSRLVAFGEKTV